ncbi:MAG: hypothetical protein ACREQ4_12775 [Candidatus Binataceae bacterium]
MTPSRRDYGARPPGTEWERRGLRRVSRGQTLLLCWLAALIPASWLVMLAPDGLDAVIPFLFAWLGIAIAIGWHAGESRCPRCRQAFHRDSKFPYFDTVFSHQCANCGLTLPRHRSARGVGDP